MLGGDLILADLPPALQEILKPFDDDNDGKIDEHELAKVRTPLQYCVTIELYECCNPADNNHRGMEAPFGKLTVAWYSVCGRVQGNQVGMHAYFSVQA